MYGEKIDKIMNEGELIYDNENVEIYQHEGELLVIWANEDGDFEIELYTQEGVKHYKGWQVDNRIEINEF